MKKLFTCLVTLFYLSSHSLHAQRENQNWYFGNHAAISFASTYPTDLPNSAMVTYEAAASVSDATGNLLFYTNGVNIWDQNNQFMTNGQVIGGHESASQGVVIVKNPGNATQYYVFVVDGCDNQLVGGLKYSVVDMTQNGGLGAVTNRATQLSAISMTEKVTAVPHANGRDYWIITHGWQSSLFYCFLLSPSGIATTPVVTNIGLVHTGGGGNFGNANAMGYMKASPNSRKFASSMRDNIFELFDFDPSTGQFSNYVPLQQFYRSYGVAFSPDGTKLYGSTLDGGEIYQFNLLAGSGAAIATSGTRVGSTTGIYVGALQLGPDNKIYAAMFNSPYLGIFPSPNSPAPIPGFTGNAVFLGGGLGQLGLPNFPSGPAVEAAPTVTISVLPVCLGAASSFAAAVSPAPAATTYVWNFGEPASGVANTGTGATLTHTYAAAGTYTVTLSTTIPGLPTPLTTTQQVTVYTLPMANLGPATQRVCQGTQHILTPGPQPTGTTYRWQDGSISPTYTVTTTGTYAVEVTSAAGCTARASVHVEVEPLPVVNIVPNTGPLCQGQSVVLTAGAQPAGTTYRWQDNSTANTFTVTKAGVYSLVVISPFGCTAQSTVNIQYVAPPVVSLGPATQQLCEGQSLTLTAGLQAAGTTYRWQDNSTDATYLVRQAGTYSVTVTSPQGCTAQAATTVAVAAAPTVQLGPDIATCLDQPVLLQANAQPTGTTFRWQDGSTNPTFLATKTGTFTLNVTTSEGCTVQDEVVVSDSGCPFKIPNIITPNGDNANDAFVLQGLNPRLWRLEIYNRWGKRIYQTVSYDNTWKAADQANGVYYYLLTHTTNGQQHRGWVEVVR